MTSSILQTAVRVLMPLLLLFAHLRASGVALRVLRGALHRFGRLLNALLGFVDAFRAGFGLLLLQTVL